MIRKASTPLGLVVAAVLGGCALSPPPTPDEYRAEALPHLQVPSQWTAGPTEGAVAAGWVATFGDARLDALVAEAIANNPDLRVAATRVQVAAEYAQLSDSTLWPQVNLLARGGGALSGDSSGLQGVGIFANWEIDLWGRVRSQQAAQYAAYEATAADAEYARQSIAALTAKSYYLAIEASLQQKLAQDMIEAAASLVTLSEQRERIGKGNGYDSAIARASVETYRDAAEQFGLARTQALRSLEALLGRYPAAQVETATQLVDVKDPVPAGLPSQLLERRADVVAADRRVAAAFHMRQEAKAARLPSIKLTAAVTDISSDLFVLKNRDNPVWSAGASLLLPLFAGGALKQQVQIRTAEQAQAVAQYGQVGARAFSEVESALSAEFAARRREALLARATSENLHASELAQVRYRVGSGDLRGVQQQQLSVYGSRSALLRVQAEQLVQRVNLYLALGGGFDTGGPAPAVASTKE